MLHRAKMYDNGFVFQEFYLAKSGYFYFFFPDFWPLKLGEFFWAEILQPKSLMI